MGAFFFILKTVNPNDTDGLIYQMFNTFVIVSDKK